MKIAKNLAASLLLLSSLFFVRCTPEMDFVETPQEVLSRGNWTVDYFFADGDKTAHYTSCQFTFNANGTVSCIDASEKSSGKWEILRNVNGADQLKIQMVTQQAHLQEINVPWSVIYSSVDAISLKSAQAQSDVELRLRKKY